MTSAIIAAHSVVTRSTCSRTAGSLVRSDSKTSRKAPVVAGDVVVERVHRRRHALLVVVRWTSSAARQLSMIVSQDGVEQREVEVELAGEVLVEHRLGDPGPLGDVVHRGGVVALGDEHLERGLEQLGAALAARQPAAARRGAAGRTPVAHARRPHSGGSRARSLPGGRVGVRMTGRARRARRGAREHGQAHAGVVPRR